MKKFFTSLTILIFIGINNFTASGSNAAIENSSQTLFKGNTCKSGLLVIRVKAEYRSSCTLNNIDEPRLKDALTRISASGISKKYPRSSVPSESVNKFRQKLVDLSLIYQIQFSPVIKIEEAIQRIKSSGVVEYAEPLYIHQLDFTPNDPSASAQYQLAKISAYTAWDVWTGDTNVVIGIVDSGTDWDHPDLQANIKYNYADTIDGLDNDSDGFIDNFRGWDVSENDNDPMVVSEPHGSHVSGCADAVTNNSIGVAAPAYNCKFLPVKSSLDASTGSIDNGYDGIVYAADHGVSVINCSWGGGGFSQFEQDIINYATYNKNVLVVAAAGNNGQDIIHYPSSYENVISVAATTETDSKAGFSNYNSSVDVCAPGQNILSTLFDNTYASWDGTSMASPIAAGCAAMIKSRFPSLNALQVGEQLRVTCDNIYGVSGNGAYLGKLGNGRVNLFKAVTDSLSPGVIDKKNDITDGNDNVFIAGDTLTIVSHFENLLRATSNLTCSLTSTNPYVQILQGNFIAGVLNTLDTISNFSTSYRVVLLPSAPVNTEVEFRVTLTDGTWNDIFGFTVIINVDYINIAVNHVASSISSKSMIGYNQTGQLQGLGFTYKNSPTILYDMGFMVGVQNRQVSDNVRGDGTSYDSDFAPYIKVSSLVPGTISDFDVNGVFKDNGSTSSSPLDLIVTQHAYAWVSAPDDNYIMVQYNIKNNSVNTLNNLYAGIFADWDIPLYSDDKCSTDNLRRLGYVWSTDSAGLYAGVKLLSHTAGFNHYAFDNTAANGGIDLTNGFSNAEKYTGLSTSRLNAGIATATGNDVLSAVSSGSFNMAPGDSVEVAFALIAGKDLASIQASADAAQAKYDSIFVGILPIGNAIENGLYQSFPNPADKELRINLSLKESNFSELSIYNLLGEKVKTVFDEKITAGSYSVLVDVSKLPSGNYFYRLNSGNYTRTLPLSILHH